MRPSRAPAGTPPRSAAPFATFVLALGLAACSGSGGSGSAGPPGSPGTVTAGFAAPSEYAPEPHLLTRYWKRHCTDAVGTVDLVIELDSRARGGERLAWEVDPVSTAIEGVHWTSPAPGTLALPAGADEASLPIEVVPRGVFFLEKRLRLRLVAVEDVEVDDDAAVVELWIRPSAEPPTVDVTAAHTNVASAGDEVALEFRLDAPSDEEVHLHWQVEGELAEHLIGPEPGEPVLAPGATIATVVLVYDGLGAPGEQARVRADYERDGIERSFELDDGSLQHVHVDENLWTFSQNLPDGLEETEAHPFIPAFPTNLHPGGVPIIDDGPVAEILRQTDPDPRLDPFTGTPLVATTPTQAAGGAFPYIRNSFINPFCNGPPQLVTLDAWVRTSYYLAKFRGLDIGLNTTFHRTGVRVRTEDLDHAVIFRSDSPGFDHEGNPVPVAVTEAGDLGVWRVASPHPTDGEWGVFEDQHGVGIYFIHHLDPSIVWPDGLIETPGVDVGNPIHYPTWYVPGDGSELQGPMHSMRGRGTLAYGFWFEMSATPLSGPPERVWPKLGNWWEPRGNAAMPMSPGEHVVETL